jgi:hypothetical protein
VIAVVSGVALVAVLITTGGRARGAHPEPRAGVTAEAVLGPGEVPRTPGALEAYAAARTVPGVLDGTYCHCDCAEHAGHRSLLTCFESEHGAYCDICIGEALLAERMSSEGRSLDEIRQAVDRQFGG